MKKFNLLFLIILLTLNIVITSASAKEIPDEWLIFDSNTIPFVPFQKEKDNYVNKYNTPLDITQYASKNRIYNPNYKPYVPNQKLYTTSDYSYSAFLKHVKNNNTKISYDDWLWETIRTDFKNVHGMYTENINKNGKTYKITWEDGGILSIYEQRKIFFKYLDLSKEKAPKRTYEFLQNFMYKYPLIRVNNPYIIFVKPQMDSNSDIYTNQLFVTFVGEDIDAVPYHPEYQKYKYKLSEKKVIKKVKYRLNPDSEHSEFTLSYKGPNDYMGADGQVRIYSRDLELVRDIPIALKPLYVVLLIAFYPIQQLDKVMKYLDLVD